MVQDETDSIPEEAVEVEEVEDATESVEAERSGMLGETDCCWIVRKGVSAGLTGLVDTRGGDNETGDNECLAIGEMSPCPLLKVLRWVGEVAESVSRRRLVAFFPNAVER